jgi:hypothetical protein
MSDEMYTVKNGTRDDASIHDFILGEAEKKMAAAAAKVREDSQRSSGGSKSGLSTT